MKHREKGVCVTHRLQLLKALSNSKCWHRRPKSSKRLWPKATAGQHRHRHQHHGPLPAACRSKPVFTCPTYLQTHFCFLLSPPPWCFLWTRILKFSQWLIRIKQHLEAEAGGGSPRCCLPLLWFVGVEGDGKEKSSL